MFIIFHWGAIKWSPDLKIWSEASFRYKWERRGREEAGIEIRECVCESCIMCSQDLFNLDAKVMDGTMYDTYIYMIAEKLKATATISSFSPKAQSPIPFTYHCHRPECWPRASQDKMLLFAQGATF